MSRKKRYHYLLKSVRNVDFKCDRILGILAVMRRENQGTMLESIKESARDMYLCSLEERRRTGKFIGIPRHD